MASDLINKIVSLYLYGTQTPPSNLISDGLIRPDNATTSVTLSASAYMTTGGGRFAKASQFEVVTEFFDLGNTLSPGSYTLLQILTQLSLISSSATAIIDQKEYVSAVDYLERVFLFNNTSFKIQDSASLRFLVDPDGTRHIESLKIVPQTDNFDFTGGDDLTNDLNNAILPFIDPSDANNGPAFGIGRKVIMNFDNSAPTIANYTQANFTADNTYLSEQGGLPNQVLTLGSAFAGTLNDLWDDDITRFIDGLNRPILYGTNGGDTLSAASIDSIYDTGSIITGIGTLFIEDLITYKNNGVILIGGGGADTVNGGANGDFLYGGSGNDILIGGAGTDYLHGGIGKDTAIFSGNYADYWITGSSGNVIVTDTVNNRDGTDTLVSIERMEFADRIWENGVFRPKFALLKPVADDDAFSVGVNGSVTMNVTANDYDPDNQAMTISLGTQAANGVATLNQNGTFTYVPDTNFTGLDSFTYTITDADSLSTTATVYIAVGGNVVSGTSGNDASLNGSSGDDVILGLAGNDSIAAGNGDDIVYGDAGNDTIHGGDGADKLYGGDGNDNLYGGAGNDYLYGGAGHDKFYDNEGSDQYFGGSGSDQYYFDMMTATGWAGINENDAQGSDVIYITNADTADCAFM